MVKMEYEDVHANCDHHPHADCVCPKEWQ
jgi:hypothetical protein